jgi:hypothetical protein
MISIKPLTVLSVVVFCVGPFLHADPTTRPAIEIPKDETPLQALHRSCQTFDTLDLDASLSLMNYAPGKEERFAKAYCRFALALTRVELAIVKKFDRQTADDTIRACDWQPESDIDGSQVAIDGDKATVTLKGAKDPTILRRVNGVWTVSVTDMMEGMTDAEIKDSLDYYKLAAKALSPIVHDIDTGKYETPAQLIQAVKAVVNPEPPPEPNKAGL